MANPMTRIAVFYDGSFFQIVNQYFGTQHNKKQFFNMDGLHTFIRNEVAKFEKAPSLETCQIVESHYFQGRHPLAYTQSKTDCANLLESQTFREELLIQAGVVQHYYPTRQSVRSGKYQEKGIDVWLALEAYDLAVHKRFDVLVLFSGDQDFVPLIRKVNSLGTRVMVIGVNIQATQPPTVSSVMLLKEANYTVMLDEVVDSRTASSDTILQGIFHTR